MSGFVFGLLSAVLNSGAQQESWIYYLLPALAIPAAVIFILSKKNQGGKEGAGADFFSVLNGLFTKSAPAAGVTGELGKLIHDAGYAYDAKQDIFYSHMYPWQRKFGYCRLYDEVSPSFRMIFDCDPVYFEYGKKRWLIEFWKGQYGMTTGCEVGVYATGKPDVNIPGVFTGAFYKSTSDADTLQMSVALIKNKKVLFTRKAKHWWLTGFVLGEFSEPSELTLKISITLKDLAMRREFVKGLKRANYTDAEIKIRGNTVSLVFSQPHTAQPASRAREEAAAQRSNKFLCQQYRELTKGYKDTPSKLEALRKNNPELFQSIISMGRTREQFGLFDSLKGYLS